MKRTHDPHRLFWLVAGLFLLAALHGAAQERIERKTQALVKPPTQQQIFEKGKRHDPAYSRQLRVNSRVIAAETKQSVQDAFIKVAGGEYRFRSDSSGSFSVVLPDSLAGQSLRLVAVHPEYGRIEVAGRTDEFPALIALPPSPPRKVEVVER